jgi:hypothetical protein
MSIQAPWDLGSADPVPASVVWLALSAVPASPPTLADVQSLNMEDVDAQASWGSPVQPIAGRLIWRQFAVTVSPDPEAVEYPYMVYALGLVETADPQALLAVLELDIPIDLLSFTDADTVNGYIQAAQGSGING